MALNLLLGDPVYRTDRQVAFGKPNEKDRSLRQLLQGSSASRSNVGAAEGCDLLIFQTKKPLNREIQGLWFNRIADQAASILLRFCSILFR